MTISGLQEALDRRCSGILVQKASSGSANWHAHQIGYPDNWALWPAGSYPTEKAFFGGASEEFRKQLRRAVMDLEDGLR